MEPCPKTTVSNGGRIWRCDLPIRHAEGSHYFVLAAPDVPKPAAGRLEADLEAFFAKRIHLLGGMTVKMVAVQAGTPDRLVMMPGGHIFLVELKREQGAPSPIQVLWHERARRLGVEVHVVYGKVGVINWLRQVMDAIS